MDRHIEINLGNVLLITLIAAIGVGVLIVGARMAVAKHVPVAEQVGSGLLGAYGVAA